MKTIIAIFLLLLAAMARDKNWNLLKILLFFAAVGLFVSHAIDIWVDVKGREIGLYVIEKSTRRKYEEICEGRLMKKDENTSEIEIIEYYDI